VLIILYKCNANSCLTQVRVIVCCGFKGRAYVLSSMAALRIASVSTDVIFNAMEDVYITGVCRAVAGIRCTCIPGIPRMPETVSDCELASSSIKNMHPVLRAERMEQLWALSNNKTARESCSTTPSIDFRELLAILVAVLLFIFIYYTRRRFSVCKINGILAIG